MRDELENNPIDSRECTKCKGVSHHLFPKNTADLYLQRGITLSSVYCSPACMMSMEQAMSMDGNEKIVAIRSNIEVYHKYFREMYARNKIIKNVAWGVFQKCKNSEDEYFFCSELY